VYNLLKKTPYIFWGAIPFLIFYVFINSDKLIDINIKDTYFVMSIYMLIVPLILLLFSTGLAYYLAYYSENFEPVSSLTIIHVLITFSCLAILFFAPRGADIEPSKMIENLENYRLYEDLFEYSVTGLIIAQVIFIINLVLSLFRRVES